MVPAKLHFYPFLPQANAELPTPASLPHNCLSRKLCHPCSPWSQGLSEGTNPALGSAHMTRSGLGWGWHMEAWQCQPTRPFSMHTVSMMMLQTFCSHTSLQKSSIVFFRGPWVAMNSCWDA